jgi:glycosyltransferase involved in cell wall biosynthesis
VLAPAITGIPELVTAGETGFLYEPGSLDDFVARLLFIRSLTHGVDDPDLHSCTPSMAQHLDSVRHAARVRVCHDFNRRRNLESFGDLFLQRITPRTESVPDENFILQQI